MKLNQYVKEICSYIATTLVLLVFFVSFTGIWISLILISIFVIYSFPSLKQTLHQIKQRERDNDIS